MDSLKLLSTDEVLELLGCSITHLKHLRELGFLKPIFINHSWKYPKIDFQMFLYKYGGENLSNLEELKKVKSKYELAENKDDDIFTSIISKSMN